MLWNNTGKTWNECAENSTSTSFVSMNCTVNIVGNANITNFFNDTNPTGGARDGFRQTSRY